MRLSEILCELLGRRQAPAVQIEFATEDRFYGVIPEPYPAAQYSQNWFRKLPPKTGTGLEESTVKRCAPFIEAMSAGFIIPLAADVAIRMSDGGATVETNSKFEDTVISTHNPDQLGGESFPLYPSPPLKFGNFWAIKAPPGWSVLFCPPLNRPEERFECFSGIVECDRYWNYVNFPFVMTDPYFDGVLPMGTPIIQAIPFRRAELRSVARLMTKAELDARDLTERRLQAHESYYRDKVWRGRCPHSRKV